jgi:hypothetical protein
MLFEIRLITSKGCCFSQGTSLVQQQLETPHKNDCVGILQSTVASGKGREKSQSMLVGNDIAQNNIIQLRILLTQNYK